jgi:hypothetical protein
MVAILGHSKKNVINRKLNAIGFTGDTVYFVGQYAIIFRSTDLGATWTPRSGGSGPKANVWRAYYYENNGREILFMATEAGLFALDYPLSAQEQISNDGFKIFLLPGKYSFFVDYKLNNPTSTKLNFNIYNLLGQKIYSTQLNVYGKAYQDFVVLPFTLQPGVYIVQIIEGPISKAKTIIVD